MRPLRDWLLLEPEKVSTGIIVTQKTEEDVYSHEAYKVVARGQEVMVVREGDVIIQEGAARKFKYKDKNYYACREDEVCFIVIRKKGE